MPRQIADVSIHQAVEITKAAITGQNGPWMNSPQIVTTLIEAVANKLEELRIGPGKH